jgi:hypothetical protein
MTDTREESDLAALEALFVRVQARRVAQCYQGAGRVIPPATAAILASDTEAAWERDNEAFIAWCRRHNVDCVRVLGVSDFRPW